MKPPRGCFGCQPPCPDRSLLCPQGDNVRQELLALVKDLPSLLSEIGAGASALSEAIELYQACVEFVCERWAGGGYGGAGIDPHISSAPRVGTVGWAGGGFPAAPKLGLSQRDPGGVGGAGGGPCPVPGADIPAVAASSAELVVPLLRHVGKKGNTTVYEWRTGLPPLRVERPEVEEVPEQPKEDTVCPDQPGPSCGAGESPSPLCHSSVRVRLLAPGVSGGLLSFSLQIDWGDFTLEPTRVDDGAAANGGAQSEEIDWGITLEPGPQVRDPWLCGLGVWPCSGAGYLGVSWAPPHLTGHPFVFAAR